MSKLSKYLNVFRDIDYTTFSYWGDDLEEQIKELSRDHDEIIYLPELSMSIGGYAFADTSEQFGWMFFQIGDGQYEMSRYHLSDMVHHDAYIVPMETLSELRDERDMLMEHTGTLEVVASDPNFDIIRFTDGGGRVVSYWTSDEKSENYTRISVPEAYGAILANPQTTIVISKAGLAWEVLSAMVQASRDHQEIDPESDEAIEFQALASVDMGGVMARLIGQ